MRFSRTLGLVLFILENLFWNVSAITYQRNGEHQRISRAHLGEPPISDWEIGLREAAHQALLRDGYTNPSLHNYLQNAPFSGKQTVKVFGDIAILARGQLYATPLGFNFVQDPYHNDCEQCHNEKQHCKGNECTRHPQGPEQLIALWTVKRIRHRDDNYGHRYEIEYTISPVDKALRNGFITRNGKFDYGIPGHVFVIRSNPRYTNGYLHNKFFSSPDQIKWHRQYIPPILLYPTPIGNNAFSTPQGVAQEVTPSSTNLNEIQLYRRLINSLASKTTTTGHRFKIATPSTVPQGTIDRITAPVPITRSYQITAGPPERTTLIQLPTGQIVPLYDIPTSTISDSQLQILTPVQITLPHDNLIPTQAITTENIQYPQTQQDISKQIPSTRIPVFVMKELIPPLTTSVKPDTVKEMGSTKLPKKTTIHFFAAEDEDKSAQKETYDEDIFGDAKKFTTRVVNLTTPSSRRTTISNYDDDEDLNLFPAVEPTKSMRKTTEVPFRETSPMVNQVQRPYKDSTTPSSVSFSRQPKTTFDGRLMTSEPTHTPLIDNTQTHRTTFPIQTTTEQQDMKFRTPTVFQPAEYQTHYYSSKPTEPSTLGYNFDVSSTPEPRETIVTVTPIQSVSISHYDISSGSTQPYTSRTFSNTEYSSEQKETTSGRTTAKTTFVYPSTNMISTTASPRLLSTFSDVTKSINEMYTTEAYSINTESLPTTEGKLNTLNAPTMATNFNTYGTVSTVDTYTQTNPMTGLFTTIFGASKPTRIPTTKLKPVKSKKINDFLLEDISDDDASEPLNKNRSKFQEYTDEDIFGPLTQPKKKKQNKYKSQTSKFTTEPTRTVAKTPKIIYSDFFEASTVPPTSSLTQFYAESQNSFVTKPLGATTERPVLTSQSYLTSISYKVSKKHPPPTDEIEVLPTVKAKLSDVIDNDKVQIFKAELPDTPDNDENSTRKVSEKDAFDSIALQLVNHARSLDLLGKNSTVEKKETDSKKTTPKYRRRMYLPKFKRNQVDKRKLVT